MIGELSEKLFGGNVAGLQEEATVLAERLMKTGEEEFTRVKVLGERLEELKGMAASSGKVLGLEEVLAELKELDVVNAKEVLQTTKAELKAKLRQLVSLTTKVKQLEKKGERVEELEEEMRNKDLQLQQAEKEKEVLLEKVENVEQEKETVREETMEFAHKVRKRIE